MRFTRPRVFEPFTRLEPLRHKHVPGVGLGLTLVRELARAIAGELSPASTVESGSTFTPVLGGSAGAHRRASDAH